MHGGKKSRSDDVSTTYLGAFTHFIEPHISSRRIYLTNATMVRVQIYCLELSAAIQHQQQYRVIIQCVGVMLFRGPHSGALHSPTIYTSLSGSRMA